MLTHPHPNQCGACTVRIQTNINKLFILKILIKHTIYDYTFTIFTS